MTSTSRPTTKWASVAGLAVAITATWSWAASAQEPSQLVRQVEEVMRATMAEQSIPGAVVAVIDEGEVAVLAGYGVSDVAAGAPVDATDTVFHVASISKHVTAIAVLQLVEQGRLALHADVNEYLDGWHIEAPEPVTLHQLMTHTSGLDRGLTGRKVRDPLALQPLGEFLSHNLPPVVRRPGELSVYSNYGLAVAGHAVETVAGVPFAEYAREHIFLPLGMTSSSFGLEPALEARMATGYSWFGTQGPPEPLDYIHTAPASMLRTTAADMARLMSALLAGGELEGVRIFKSETAALILSQQHSNHPLMRGRSYGLSEGERFSPPSYLHTGGTAGFSSAVLYLPEARFAIFVSFNSRGFAWDLINTLLDRFNEHLARPRRAEYVDSLPDLQRFAGWYRSAEMPRTGPGKLATLVEQTHVEVLPDGALGWDGGRYEAVDSLAFRAGGGRLIAFGERGGQIHYLFRPGGEYERLSWWEALPVQMALWSVFVLVFLAGSLAGLVGTLRRRRHGRIESSPLARRSAFLACLLYLLFIGATGAILAQEMGPDGSLQYGMPMSIRALFVLPWLGILLSLIAATGMPTTLHDSGLGTSRRWAAVGLVAVLEAAIGAHLLRQDRSGRPDEQQVKQAGEKR